MIKKFGIIGDVHWSTYSSIHRKRGVKYSDRLEKLLESINWAEKFLSSNGCESIMYLGDFCDRPDLSAEEITALQDIKWASTKHTFIVGNHESNVADLNFSSTKLFESIGAKVVTNPQTEEINDYVNFTYIPYISTNKVLSLLDYIKDPDKKNIVFSHQDIAGIQYGKFTTNIGFDLNDINNNCALFLNGHLHNTMCRDKLYLVGNLTGQNFNENAMLYKHYIYILTVEDDKVYLDSYLNPYAVNYYKLSINTTDDYKLLNLLDSNAIVSLSCNSDLITDINRLVKSNKNIIECRITGNSYLRSNDDFEISFSDDHLKEFINFVKIKIPNSSLLEEELSLLEGK